MTLQQLRYFCEIAACNWNISRAAQSLNTSQPGMSRQMQFLEEELGLAVFMRRKNRIVGVTEPGGVALAIARRIVAESESLKLLRSQFDEGATSTLTIAATHTQARHVLPAVLKEFTRDHPDVEVSLKQGIPSHLASLVESGEADMSISTMPPTVPDDVVMLECSVVERVAVMPSDHPLVRAKMLTLADIAAFPIITYDEAFIGRSMVLGAFEQSDLTPKVALSAVDTDVMKAYAAQGLGIAIISELAFDADADRGLCAIRVSDLFGRDTIYLGLRRFTHLRRLVRAFIARFAPDLDMSSIALVLNAR